MNMPTEPLTPEVLRGWSLPPAQGSKYARGQLLVVGGARATPGGAAALIVGAAIVVLSL